ncbi:hypothetical protein [Pedobacter sp. NJ-S-72]
MESNLSLIVLILTIAIAAIPSFTVVVIKNRGVRFKNITHWGWVTLQLCVVLILVQYIQYRDNKKNEYIRDATYNRKLDKMSKQNEKFLLQNNESIVNGYTDALEKYHLKYDADNKRVILDSSKIINNNISKMPEFDVSLITLDSVVNKSDYYFSISYTSKEASTYNINIKLQVADMINGKYYKVNAPEYLYGKNGAMGMGTMSTKQIILSETAEPVDNFAFHFKGTYSDYDGKLREFDRVFAYGIKEKVFGTLFSTTDELAKAYFKRVESNY